MSGKTGTMSRRAFLIRTSLFAAGACAGSSIILKPLARALDAQAAGPVPPRIAIILDDVGFSIKRVTPFLEMPGPITYSILPHMPFSATLAERIHGLGHEVMLHQPMEPHSSQYNPGPGSIYLSQGRQEIEAILRRNLENFPHAAGMNNHMGSRYTESRPKMQEALLVFLKKEFFFIDSFTSVRSIAYDTARSLYMTAAFSHEFIDNTLDSGAVYAQLVKLKARALKYGRAVGIGHPWPETAQGLGRFLRELQGSPFSLVYASQIAYS